jgi:HAD superfamily hydrolase (TIGR01509 family)
MGLTTCNYWIFDMDGTLTIAVHNFDEIRATLGLPPGRPILESLVALPPEQAEPLYRHLDEIELELARQATPQRGAGVLLSALTQRGAKLGILTRNNQRNALETLHACGLLDFFEPACILGREAAAPKPDPDGVLKLLGYWNVEPDAAVMVGDYLFDLQAGRRAGVTTIYFDADNQNAWTAHADYRVQGLDELLEMVIS